MKKLFVDGPIILSIISSLMELLFNKNLDLSITVESTSKGFGKDACLASAVSLLSFLCLYYILTIGYSILWI